MDQTLPFIAAARMACKLGIHTQYSWGIATPVMLATGVQVRDASMLRDSSSPPWEGVKVSQGVYHFRAFDCNKPEDALIQDLPHSCSTGVQETQPQELDQAPQQEYTILQEVATFDYPATLGTIHRSWGYYDCGWRSHVRIVAPARVH